MTIASVKFTTGRLEIPGWNTIGFDDSAWKFAERAPQPRGEKRLCTAEPD